MRRTIFYLLFVLTFSLLACEKEDPEHKMDLSCGDSITFRNLTGAKWMVTFHDPVTDVPCSSVFILEADVEDIVMQSYDGSYDNCLLAKHYVAYVMIDPSVPGTEGEWQFCRNDRFPVNFFGMSQRWFVRE